MQEQPPNYQPPYNSQPLPPQDPPYQYPPTYYTPQPPPPPPQKPSFWRRKVGCLPMWAIIVIAILFIGAIGSVASNGASSSTTLTDAQVAATNSAQLAATNAADCASNPSCASNTTPVPTATIDTSIPTSTPAPTQTPARWRTTHTYSGNGDKQTGVITVPDDWKIVWTCDARNNYGVQGFIGISVYNSDGTASYAGDVSGNCAANKVTTDSSEEHQAGDVYLKIYAGIPWTIQVQEFK